MRIILLLFFGVFLHYSSNVVSANDVTTICVMKKSESGAIIKWPILEEDLSKFAQRGFTSFECPSEFESSIEPLKKRCERLKKHHDSHEKNMRDLFGVSPKNMCKAYNKWLKAYKGATS